MTKKNQGANKVAGGLKPPKEILVIENLEKGEIIAIDGKWNRLPSDGEKLVAYYKNKHAGKYKKS